MSNILDSLRLADIADILLVSVFIYGLLRLIQTTASRSLAIATGLLATVYAIALHFDLHLTTLLFQFSLTIAMVIFVVVFQDEIRRAVERGVLVSRWRSSTRQEIADPHADTLLETAFDLAKNHRGALIVLAGEESIEAQLDGGTELLGQISQPLLDSLFDPHSAGHDGAVIIQNGFVTRFGVHLPLSESREKSTGLGTRHRSGLGLSECSDALVIIISEERGEVSIARFGELKRNVSRAELQTALSEHLQNTQPLSRPRFTDRFTSHPRTKILSLLISIAAWLSVASDQDLVQRVFVVPIEYRNLPAGVELPDTVKTEARVTFSGTERAFQFVAPSTLRVSVDLSDAANGKEEFTLTDTSVRHPATLTVYRIEPRTISLKR